MKNILLLLLSIIFIFSDLNAQKDTVSVTELFDMSLEELLGVEVSGVSRYTQKKDDVPSSILIFSQQQIKERGYKDLCDLLKDIPGIDIAANAGRFGEFYSFRGISGNDRFLVLINGHKLNPASGTFLSIGNSIAISYASRVEIIYGPASAIYGADAFSGIINIVFDNSQLDFNNLNLSAYTSYGSMNSVDAGFESAVRINKNLLLNINARMFKSDGFNVLGTDPVYRIIEDYEPPIPNKCEQPINDHNLFSSITYKNFSLNYYRQQFDQGNAYGHHPLIYVFDKANRWKTSTDIVWATYKKAFKNEGKLSFDLSYKKHIQDNNSAFHKWIIPGVPGNEFKQFMTGLDNTIQAIATYHKKVSDNLQFVAGIDFENTVSIPPYANDEVIGRSVKYEGTNAELIDNELTINENRYSAFGQITYSPLKIMTIVLGARLDNSSKYNTVLNPRFGFIVSPTKSTKIKFVYGRAFQAPSLFYQYEQFGTPTIAMISSADLQQSNPSLKLQNQIVSSYEISISQKIGESTLLKAMAYYNRLTNLIERKLFAVYPIDSVYNKDFDIYTSGLRNENIGREKIFGGEINLDAKFREKLLLMANYSYINAMSVAEDETESEIPRISKHKVRLGIAVHDVFKYFSISPGFSWNSSMYNINTTVFPDNRQPGYYSINLHFTARNFSKYFRLYANFENLLDTKIKHAGLYTQASAYTATIPQPGLTISAGIEVFFRN